MNNEINNINKIIEAVDRAISEAVYDRWGSVGFRTGYHWGSNEFEFIVWDKSHKCEDKMEILHKTFEVDYSKSTNIVIHDLVYQVEEYLIDN